MSRGEKTCVKFQFLYYYCALKSNKKHPLTHNCRSKSCLCGVNPEPDSLDTNGSVHLILATFTVIGSEGELGILPMVFHKFMFASLVSHIILALHPA